MDETEIQQHEIAEIEDFAVKRDSMLEEIRKVIVGQDQVIEEVLIALFARGHCLLVGVPGLAIRISGSGSTLIVRIWSGATDTAPACGSGFTAAT